jgi:hypothetical protein
MPGSLIMRATASKRLPTDDLFTNNWPGVSTSRSDKTRFEERCHDLSVTRESVFMERRGALGVGAAHLGEGHGSPMVWVLGSRPTPEVLFQAWRPRGTGTSLTERLWHSANNS